MVSKKKQLDRVLLINGPNLGLLGMRQPEIYGHVTLKEIVITLSMLCDKKGALLNAMQSNAEGEIINFLNTSYAELKRESPRMKSDLCGIIINPGGLSHTSVSLRDALEVFRHEDIPVVEVHLSNIHSRESFRNLSLISSVSTAVVCGLGAKGYEVALEFVLQRGRDRQK